MTRLIPIRFIPAALVLLCCLTCGAATYPLKVSSANPRLLVDQNNAPFLVVGDSPHCLIINLNDADATRFLEDRRTNGFNTMWVEVLAEDSEGGRTNGSLINGITPFTNTLAGGLWDFTTPNEDYFAHVDTVVRVAATNGILLMLNPLDTGGWTDSALTNGPARCRQYGQYLGNRYKDFPNIIWLHGNDFQTWRTNADDAAVSAIALGIRDYDTNHVQTVELQYPISNSLDSTNWANIVNLNSAYSYYTTYAEVLRAYQRTNTMPVLFLEGHYEYQTNYFNDFPTPPVLRRQEYWAMLSGSVGHIYGNDIVNLFKPGWDTPIILDSPHLVEMNYVTALFKSRRWQALVPDINHTVLTAGFGIYSTNALISTNNYATCARETNGNTVMVYAPTQRAMTIDMTKVSGTNAIAWWFNPLTGGATNFGPFPTTGIRVFTPPTTNDWVLVLDNAAINYPAPGAASLTTPLLLTSGSLADVLVGTNYQVQFTAAGGALPFTWSLAPGSSPLPGGLSLSPGGLLSGMPTACGAFNLIVRVTDADGVIATGNFPLTVNPVPLTITANSLSRSYGATNPVLTGLVEGLMPFDNITAGFKTAATTNSPIGIYPINVTLSGAGASLGNYILTINGGNLTVTPAGLVVAAADTNKVYRTTLDPMAYNVMGLFNNDSVTNVALSSPGSASNVPMGSYPIAASSALGVGLTNYTITYSNGTMSVSGADLLITAKSTNKIYGATLSPTDYTVTGLMGGDSVTYVTLASSGGASNATPGNYEIAASGALGVGLTNYIVGYSNGTLTVEAASLLIAAGNTNKTYGAVLEPVSYKITGLVNSDSVTNVTLTSLGTASNALVGKYVIEVSTALGEGLTNYTIGYSNGTLTVDAASLLIAVGNTNKTYGTVLEPVSYTLTGLLNGDSVTNVTLTSVGSVSNALVGNYAIEVSNVLGEGLTNYTMGFSNGTLAVGAAPLLIVVGSTNKLYGEALAPVDYTASGLVNSDSVTNVNLSSLGSARYAPVGDHPIHVATVEGLGLANYSIVYSNGTMTVLLPPLVIAANESNEVILSWPAPTTPFTLQASRDLSTTDWVDVPNPPIMTADSVQVAVAATNEFSFFRLFASPTNGLGRLTSPELRIAPMEAEAVLLSWPAAAPLFVLQKNTDLTTSNWVTVTNWPSFLVAGTNQITLPATNEACFFRLTVP